MKVAWFSAGVSSFVSTYLAKDSVDKIIYTHIDNQHPDSLRFIKDCEKLLKKPIEILQSRYMSVENVIQQFQYIRSPRFAICTDVLKRRVRKEWESKQTEPLEYIWGFDNKETDRVERLVEAMPEQKHIFPLLEKDLSKKDVHGISARLGIKRPIMYDLGYNNNNCVGCCKGGMGYWNKIRIDFPEVFNKMATLERQVNARCLKECFLDELDPIRGRMSEEITEDCSIFCQLALD